MTTTTAITLGAYPMRSCAFHAYLTHAPHAAGVPQDEVDAMTRRRGERGRAFEVHVVTALQQAFGSDCRVIGLLDDERALSWPEQQRVLRDRTLEAMDDGVAVICGGSLIDPAPLDGEVVRTGDPDVLVRRPADDGDDGVPRYVPVEVKNHRTLAPKKRQFARRSVLGDLLTDPRTAAFADGLGWAPGYRTSDGLQLAHYTRLLEALGRHPGPAQRWGGVIGADPSSAGLQVTWLDLDEPQRGESVLGKYDAAFAVRRDAISQARAGVRFAEGSAEGVGAGRFGKAECGGCSRRTACVQDAGPDDASFRIAVGRPNAGGWAYLYEQGAGTVHALADLPVPHHEDGYLAAARSQGGSPPPLAHVVERARMHRDGELLRLTDPSATVPTFDLEIDFDIEWDEDQLVYQWGAVVRTDQDPATATYEHSRYEFGPQNRPEAERLSAEFFANLDVVIEQARAAGRTVGLFHWTPPEQWQTGKFLGETLTERYGASLVHDLQVWVKDTYFSRDGFSLKRIAPACGFTWSVDDAGGAMSMVMVDQYRTATDPHEREQARRWLLDYNEADCHAQSAIRDHLRSLPSTVADGADPDGLRRRALSGSDAG